MDIRIGLMLGKLAGKGREKAAPKPSQMSFELTESAGEMVEQLESGSAILRSNNGYIYAAGYGHTVSRSDVAAMEAAKGEIIERLSAGKAMPKALFDSARGIAGEVLLGRTDPENAAFLSMLVAHDTAGCGPIGMLLQDRKIIEEIEINSPGAPISVYTTKYGRCATNIRFASEAAFRYDMNKFISESEKELSEDSPVIDVQVNDARIHAQIRPYATSGAAAAIRLGGEKRVTIDFLLRNRTVTPDALAYLWLAVDAGMNLVISGSPASGKTTLLGTIAGFIPQSSRIITIEEGINELQFNDSFRNIISLYGERYRVTTKEQVLNALRLRPDRIVVGEIRGEEARDLFAGSNVGVPFMTTMHSADDPMAVVKRLMVRPMSVEVRSISMLDVSLHMLQPDLRARRLNSIYEYRWLSRAETMEGTLVGEEEMVAQAKVLENGELARGALQSSKVLSAFSRMRGFSAKRTLQELESRSDFLRRITPDRTHAMSLSEIVSAYGR